MNLVDILNELGIPFKSGGSHHHVSHGWAGVDCPDCSPGTGRYRLGFNLSSNYATCWVCGYKHLPTVLRQLAGSRSPHVSNLLKDITRERLPEKTHAGTLKIPACVGDLLPVHKRYLKSRGFKPEEIERVWGIKGIGLAPELAWRIWIPIHLRGECVSWTARAVGDVTDRYRSAKEDQESVPAKSLLYGADHARHAAVIVEGPTDAWRIGTGAVAVLGLVYSRAQLLRMSKFPVRAVCFDNSPDAQRRADRLCEDLACFEGKTHRVVLDSEDPGSASVREVRAIRKHFLE